MHRDLIISYTPFVVCANAPLAVTNQIVTEALLSLWGDILPDRQVCNMVTVTAYAE